MPAWRALAKQAGARRRRIGRPSAVDPAASAVGTSEGKPPRADSLGRCRARGCQLGVLVRAGAGTTAEAFRYGLAKAYADA